MEIFMKAAFVLLLVVASVLLGYVCGSMQERNRIRDVLREAAISGIPVKAQNEIFIVTRPR